MTVPTTSTMITYVRRIVKTPNAQDLSDTTILEYINRFLLFDVPYRIQQFSLRSTFSFETIPNVDRYDLPIDDFNSILPPLYVDGSQTRLEQSNDQFRKLFPIRFDNRMVASGNGATTSFSFTLINPPVLRGHRGILTTSDAETLKTESNVFVTGVNTSGNTEILKDDPDFAGATANVGVLVNESGADAGSVNYITGETTANFSTAIASGESVFAQTVPYQAGRPQLVLFYQNVFTVRPVPSRSYLIKMDAYQTPAAFLAGEGVILKWMAEYLARGAARKILQDLGDLEQLQFYEAPFREQEMEVLRRSNRQESTQRTATIFSAQIGNNPFIYNSN